MTTTQRVDKADIEAKLRQIRDETERTTEAAKPRVLAGAGVLVVIVLVVAYLLGRQRGRKGRTVVEIRRV